MIISLIRWPPFGKLQRRFAQQRRSSALFIHAHYYKRRRGGLKNVPRLVYRDCVSRHNSRLAMQHLVVILSKMGMRSWQRQFSDDVIRNERMGAVWPRFTPTP